MFTINDLLDQVDCQGSCRVSLIEENGDLKDVYAGELGGIPYKYGSKELCYIWSDSGTTVYEIRR